MREFLYAPMAGFALSLLLGPLIIPYFRRLKIGQSIRADGPASHQVKVGTPTMGGVIFLAAIFASLLLFGLRDPFLQIALVVTLTFGLIGFLDDYLKVVRKRSLGLRARDKLSAQIATGIFLAWAALDLGLGTYVRIPFGGPSLDLGNLYYPFVVLVIVSTANTVNLTDGLDGLAAGTTAFSFLAFFLLSVAAGRVGLALFCLTTFGAVAGFLRFNLHPARIFMGDTGSLALGAGLASVAVLTKTELLLPVIGGVYVIEGLSVILQVLFYRTTGRRLFRMSPLHHHFELAGWPETRVVYTFWAASLFFAVIGFIGARGLGSS